VVVAPAIHDSMTPGLPAAIAAKSFLAKDKTASLKAISLEAPL